MRVSVRVEPPRRDRVFRIDASPTALSPKWRQESQVSRILASCNSSAQRRTGSPWCATEWLQRFETAMRALPDRQRLVFRAAPAAAATSGPRIRCARKRSDRPNASTAAVQEAKIGPDKDIPHVTAPIVVKCITSLKLMGLL